MRLTRIELENILSFGRPQFVLDDLGSFTTIVGPNSAGKTNVFRAAQFVADVFSRTVLSADPYIHNFDTSRLLRARLGARLSGGEVGAMVELAVAASKMEVQAGGPASIDIPLRNRLVDRLLSFLAKPFEELFSGELIFSVQSRDTRTQPLDYFIEFPLVSGPVYLTQNGLTASPGVYSGWSGLQLFDEVTRELEGKFPGAIAAGPGRRSVGLEDVDTLGRTFGTDWLLSRLRRKTDPPVVLSSIGLDFSVFETRLGARGSEIAGLRRYLDLEGIGTRAIGLRDLAGLIIQRSILALSSIRSLPDPVPVQEALVPGAPERPINGRMMASDLFRLKNSERPWDRERFNRLAQVFFELSGFKLEVVAETTEPGSTTTPALGAPPVPLSVQDGRLVASPSAPPQPTSVAALRFSDDAIEFPVERAAAGLYDLLTVLYTALGRSGSVILLDEPAINLHPTVQSRLLEVLFEASGELSNQVILVTHSPYLVSARRATSIVRLDRLTDGTTVHRIAGMVPPDLARLVSDLERDPKLRAALFARKVILTEGAAEEAAFTIWLEKVEPALNLGDRGVAVMDVGGNLSFDAPARVLEAWGIPYRIIADGGSHAEVEHFGTGIAFCYGHRDMSDLLSKECGDVLEEVKRSVRAASGAKAPAVAREVAFRTEPPPTARKVADFLRPWIDAG